LLKISYIQARNLSAIIHSFHIRTFWSEAFSIKFINIEKWYTRLWLCQTNCIFWCKETFEWVLHNSVFISLFFRAAYFQSNFMIHWDLTKQFYTIEVPLNLWESHSVYLSKCITHIFNKVLLLIVISKDIVVVIDSFETLQGIQFYKKNVCRIECNICLYVKTSDHSNITRYLLFSLIAYFIQDASSLNMLFLTFRYLQMFDLVHTHLL